MADKRISQLNLHSNVTLSDQLAIVNSNETKRSVVGSIGEAIRNMETPLTASSIVSSGDILPSAAQIASLGSAERPFASLFVQSGSIQIESDTPGDPSAYISNFNGNVDIQAAGFSLTSASLTPFQINNQGQVRVENGFVDPSKLPIFGIIGNNEGSSSLAVNPGTLIQTTGFNGISNRTIFDSYGGSGVFSQLNLRNANGTAANPSTTVAGVIGRVGVSGWVDGIDFGIPGETALPARIDFRTPGYASGSRPTEIWFYTTPENQLDPQGEYAVKIYGNNVLDVSGSFTASLQENYIWLGNSNNRSEAVPYSTLPNLTTGSLMITGSLSGTTLTFEKGDSSTFDINLGDTFISSSQTGSLVNTSYGLFNQTGSLLAVSASVAEHSLINGGIGTLSVPANGFSQGDAYHLVMTGVANFKNNDTLDIKIKTGATVLTDTGAFTITNAGDSRWRLDVNFSIHNIGPAGTARIVSSGIFTYTQNAGNAFVGKNFGTENSGSFDTTIDNTLDITAQFSSTNNTMTSRLFTLHKVY